MKCLINALHYSTSSYEEVEVLFEECFLMTRIGDGYSFDFLFLLNDQLGDLEWISL